MGSGMTKHTFLHVKHSTHQKLLGFLLLLVVFFCLLVVVLFVFIMSHSRVMGCIMHVFAKALLSNKY